MLLDVAWVLDTAVRSWVPISCDSSWQSSLGWGMLDFFWDATLLRRVISPAWWDLNAPLPGFSHFLGLFPSSFAPLWIFFCQIPHVTEGKCSQFLCLILNPSILSGMGSVQGIIFSFTFVTIFIDLSALPTGETIGLIQGSLRYGSPLGRFGTSHWRTFHPAYYCPHPSICCCTAIIMPWMRNSTAWCLQPLVIL